MNNLVLAFAIGAFLFLSDFCSLFDKKSKRVSILNYVVNTDNLTGKTEPIWKQNTWCFLINQKVIMSLSVLDLYLLR